MSRVLLSWLPRRRGPGWWLHLIALIGLIAPMLMQPAQAHFMVAQRGTLNIVGDGAFMVLSLPVSALSGVDDDGYGKLSLAEFSAHRATIAAVVAREFRLTDAQGARPLEAVMLSRSPPDEAPTAPSAQLVVLGRFALASAHSTESVLRFETGLFGKAADERSFQVTATRPATGQKQLLVLTPQQPARALFPSAWAVFADYAALGAEHIVTGLDHLLFSLVVLAASWGWRQVLLALTTFTVGHAITLMVSVWGGLSVPAWLVEPAIAATIVGMAAFDFHARRNGRLPSPWLRLSLVFGCALIHGLGLASALTELGLDSQHQLPSLAGFNVGIELGQVAVALLAGCLVSAVRRLHRRRRVDTGHPRGFSIDAGYRRSAD